MTYVWRDLFQCNLVLVVDIPWFARYLSEKEESVCPEGFIGVSPKWIRKESNGEKTFSFCRSTS